MMRTIDPDAATRIHDRLQEAGIAALDALVIEDSARATSGESAMIAGGDAAKTRRVMYDVIDYRVPRMIAGDFTPGGTVDIFYKDQELEPAFAKSLGVPLLLANINQQVYQMARAAGLAKETEAS
jgi:3-hydroxyisobutyrate dehydrogenase-like beta-hydroxyacid dehydrogenase